MVSSFARHDWDMLCALETHRQSQGVYSSCSESERLKAEKGGTGGTAELRIVKYTTRYYLDGWN